MKIIILNIFLCLCIFFPKQVFAEEAKVYSIFDISKNNSAFGDYKAVRYNVGSVNNIISNVSTANPVDISNFQLVNIERGIKIFGEIVGPYDDKIKVDPAANIPDKRNSNTIMGSYNNIELDTATLPAINFFSKTSSGGFSLQTETGSALNGKSNFGCNFGYTNYNFFINNLLNKKGFTYSYTSGGVENVILDMDFSSKNYLLDFKGSFNIGRNVLAKRNMVFSKKVITNFSSDDNSLSGRNLNAPELILNNSDDEFVDFVFKAGNKSSIRDIVKITAGFGNKDTYFFTFKMPIINNSWTEVFTILDNGKIAINDPIPSSYIEERFILSTGVASMTPVSIVFKNSYPSYIEKENFRIKAGWDGTASAFGTQRFTIDGNYNNVWKELLSFEADGKMKIGFNDLPKSVKLELPLNSALKVGNAYFSGSNSGYAFIGYNSLWFSSDGFVIPDDTNNEASSCILFGPDNLNIFFKAAADDEFQDSKFTIDANGNMSVNGEVTVDNLEIDNKLIKTLGVGPLNHDGTQYVSPPVVNGHSWISVVGGLKVLTADINERDKSILACFVNTSNTLVVTFPTETNGRERWYVKVLCLSTAIAKRVTAL